MIRKVTLLKLKYKNLWSRHRRLNTVNWNTLQKKKKKRQFREREFSSLIKDLFNVLWEVTAKRLDKSYLNNPLLFGRCIKTLNVYNLQASTALLCTDWLVLHLQFWKLSTVELLGCLYVSTDKKSCAVPAERKLFLSSFGMCRQEMRKPSLWNEKIKFMFSLSL